MIDMHFISLVLMAGLYALAGVMHFRKPKMYLSITPKWVPFPERINLIVGGVEIVLGIALLFSATRSYAAMGVIALLIAVFPANVYHFQKSVEKGKFILPNLLRLPVQLLLIYWAYSFV